MPIPNRTTLSLLIAAACLWRGLTSAEADLVEAEVRATAANVDIDNLTSGQARNILDDAISTVLKTTRP